METATSILDSFDSMFERFELCTKHKLLKLGVIIISFILGTVDMVSDWINWKSNGVPFGGYDSILFYLHLPNGISVRSCCRKQFSGQQRCFS